jgi:hypothetical protein
MPRRLLTAAAVAIALLIAAAPAGAKPADDRANGIIAVLIGAREPLTAPVGSTKGSFIDGSLVYGSDARRPTGSSTLPFIEQDN